MSTTTATIDRPRTNDFDHAVEEATGAPLHGASLETFQVNIGLTCNLACHHCHVVSSPSRPEQMDWPTMEMVLAAADRSGASTIDITGGAPEMNPHFRDFVAESRRRGYRVMVRTNLTIMLEDGYRDMPEFFRDHRVHLVASLPCYLEDNVDKQRGKHVYDGSIDVLQRLNAVGYGIDPELPLDLVYNPQGLSLPPKEVDLEEAYRRELDRWFGLRFTRLIAITNMPIGRFLHDLRREGRAEEYHQRLREAFNPHTIAGLMCRHQVHVSWDGSLHDCDFNYGLGMKSRREAATHIRDFDPATYVHRKIATGSHCFGCTAGAGSSCSGTLT